MFGPDIPYVFSRPDDVRSLQKTHYLETETSKLGFSRGIVNVSQKISNAQIYEKKL